MNLILLVIFAVAVSMASPQASAEPDSADFVRSVMESEKTLRKAQQVVANLGLNCADPSNVGLFLRELERVLEGIGQVVTESGLQLAAKHDYPTACHVLTNAQIASYTEGNDSETHDRCILEDGFGGCLSKSHVQTDHPHPQYYWPKYFVEVNDEGNDSHPSFSSRNVLYILSRRIAGKLAGFVDKNCALKLTSLVFGGSNALKAGGIDVGPVNLTELGKTVALSPMENLRIRGSQHATMTTFEVNLWPVGLSETLAEHLTVCGPTLKDQGKSPGGYSWPYKGVPMTCPVAMSRDAAAFWDTGVLDYLDPKSVGQMTLASNPVSCGAAAAMDAFGGMSGASRSRLGDQGPAQSATSGMSTDWRQALAGCSLPILGTAEAVTKEAVGMADPAKWQGPYCTMWGAMAPRMSSSVFGNDYAHANAALKFKTLAHELFGVPRGESERWSLAYPWEGTGSATDSAGALSGFGEIQKQIAGAWKAGGVDAPESTAQSRSEALFKPGDPTLVDASLTSKFLADTAATHAREFGYIASVSAASIAARQAAIAAYRKRYGEGKQGAKNFRIDVGWESAGTATVRFSI